MSSPLPDAVRAMACPRCQQFDAGDLIALGYLLAGDAFRAFCRAIGAALGVDHG
jgi:hypothetical protein